MELIRINKFIADAGICSRRNADELIKQGKVHVNGECVTELSLRVDPQNDLVKVDGKAIKTTKNNIYIILNKPTSVISSVDDQFGRPTVIDYVKEINARLHHVGRLDYDSSGLIILTNDGEFSNKVMHPRNNIDKEYLAHVKGIFSNEAIKAFERGIEIEGSLTAPAKVEVIKMHPHSSEIKLIIHEGKNRQIRKMCEEIGHPVLALKRVAIGNIRMGRLKEGCYRHLKQSEIEYLMGK